MVDSIIKQKNKKLDPQHTGLLLIDTQEKLFPYIENSCHVMHKIQTAIRGFQILKLPIFVTEQYPKGLGSTLPHLKGILGEQQHYMEKTTFSCLDDSECKIALLNAPVDQWVIIGIEAHICVLQTVKDLLTHGKQVAVLNDAIGSRSIYDFSTAIAELRDYGTRITTTETVLFELVRDAKAPVFKEIQVLIK